MVYVEELAWEEGWVVKVLVIVPSVSNRTRDPRIKINNRSGIYWLHAHLDTEREVRSSADNDGRTRRFRYRERLMSPSLDIEPFRVNTKIRCRHPSENRIIVSAFNATSQ